MQPGNTMRRFAISNMAKDRLHLASGKKALKEKCGEKAFLMSDELKFPIVSPYSKNCEPDCKLVHAAYVRAKEWKYNNVAQKAAELFKSHGCEKKLGIKDYNE